MRKSTIQCIASIATLLFIFIAPGQYQMTATLTMGQGQHVSTHESASAQRVVGRMISMHTVDMRKIPPIRLSLVPAISDGGTQAKKATTLTGVAPRDIHPHSPLTSNYTPGSSATPPLASNFQGMDQSYCPPAPNYCPPPDQDPDQALGTSPSWVFQGVNRWFADYNTSGTLQQGWPKSFQSFFGVPYPTGCTAIPNLFNPRAFYDPNDQRFWAAVLNNETPQGNCTSTLSLIWIAVSQTNNPNGIWNVYSFDLMLGTQNFGDFTQFGYDQHAVYFSCDMFTAPGGTGTFEYENTFGVNKTSMEMGQNVTPYGYSGFVSQGKQINGIEPVETEAYYGAGPKAGLFVSSFDYNFGGGYCRQGCSGLIVWAIAHPGMPSESLTSIQIPTSTYANAPNADQPGCTRCLWSLDPAVNSTPVWRNGQISFALVTAINNGTQIVAGIFWGQINVTLNASGVLTSASIYQSGYFSFTGDTSAISPAIMPDANNNLVMVFTESSSSIYPGAYYAMKPFSAPPGTFPDSGLAMMQGQATTPVPRWTDYSAVSVKTVGSKGVWIANEYETANQTWSTWIGDVYIGS